MDGLVVTGPQVSAAPQVQVLQPRPAGFPGYGGLVAQQPNVMYARTSDTLAFYPSSIATPDYALPTSSYAAQRNAEKPGAQALDAPAAAQTMDAPPVKTARGTKKVADRGGSTYASRHQAAESRRRQRINDRLEVLRKVVPHKDRANTAAFLEEVISYVMGLKKRLAELEGVAEADLQVPQVDLTNMLAGGAAPSAAPLTPNAPAGAAYKDTAVAASAPVAPMTDGMPLSLGGPLHAAPLGLPGGLVPGLFSGQFPDGTALVGTDGMPMQVLPKGAIPAQGMPAPGLGPNQVLVPVALMQSEQGAGQQAYVLVNREEFPIMAPAGMVPTAACVAGQPDKACEAGGEGLMGMLAGAAAKVAQGLPEGGDNSHLHADANDSGMDAPRDDEPGLGDKPAGLPSPIGRSTRSSSKDL